MTRRGIDDRSVRQIQKRTVRGRGAGGMKERVPKPRARPGPIQKDYGCEEEPGEFTGICFRDSEASRLEYRPTELARTMAAADEAGT